MDVRDILASVMPEPTLPEERTWTLCISSDPYVAQRGKTHALNPGTLRAMCEAVGTMDVLEESSKTPPVCVRCQVALMLRPRQGGKPGKRMERKRQKPTKRDDQ